MPPPIETVASPEAVSEGESAASATRRMSLGKGLVKLVRPKQWAKNLLIFAALLFSGAYKDVNADVRALLAFVAMSLVSSCTYVFNDLVDIERDRQHPKKRTRPLASGVVSKGIGIALGVGLFAVGVGIAAFLSKGAVTIIGVYLAMQVLYNWRLKRTPIADVYTIAVGFVLRAVLGAAAIGAAISGWLLFCTGALALMLGFAKRRNEFIMQGEARAGSRESLVHYTKSALDALVLMFASGAAMSYGIYTLQSQTARHYPGIILTSLFVFYGITRYVLIVFTLDEGGEPADVLFKDPHIIFSVVGFVATALLALSGLRLPILEN